MPELIPITHGWSTAPAARQAQVLEHNFRLMARQILEAGDTTDLEAALAQLENMVANLDLGGGEGSESIYEIGIGPAPITGRRFWLNTLDMSWNFQHFTDVANDWVMLTENTVNDVTAGIILFPAAPALNDVYNQNGGQWTFDGQRWVPRPRIVDHNDLPNRTAADAHPISAITGLQSALDAAQNISIARRWMLT